MGRSIFVLKFLFLILAGCASEPVQQANRDICEDFDYYMALESDGKIRLQRVDNILFDCRYLGKVTNEQGQEVADVTITPLRLIGNVQLTTHELFNQYERKKRNLKVEQAKFEKLSFASNYDIHTRTYPIKGEPSSAERVVLLIHKNFKVFLSLKYRQKDKLVTSQFDHFISKVEIQKK